MLFRASQVMYALEGGKETNVGRAMARWYGNESFLNQYIMFGDAINESAKQNEAIQRKQDLAASRVAKNDALSRLLSELPEEFLLADLKQIVTEKGMKPDTARVYAQRMVERELVMREGEGFKKIAGDK